jgi:hypothetical protein
MELVSQSVSIYLAADKICEGEIKHFVIGKCYRKLHEEGFMHSWTSLFI